MTSTELLRQAVDLYRGEVAFTFPITALPGRGGPDAVLTASYCGAVNATVAYSNTIAPTGVLGLGWTLGRSSIVTLPDHSGYALVDEDGSTTLVQTGTGADGSLLYAALDYRFWIISRQPGAEIWEITREDGSKAIYGDAASGRGTVDWGVAWGDWSGASSSLAGQRSVAVGWSLSKVLDVWGNAVTYSYDQVMAPVGGPGGLSYTRASYLSRIVGAGGDFALLTYTEKAANECPPAHADPATLNAWQDRYQTRCLTSVSVYAPGGSLIGATIFDYKGGSSDVQYVGQGTMAKRLLMSIATTIPGATPPPPHSFTYVTDTASSVLGTMATAQVPEGGKATYTYAAAGLAAGLSARDLGVTAPVRAGVTFSQPLFYFAEDYVVVTWLGSDSSVQGVAYRWVGRWIATTLTSLPLGSSAYASVMVGLGSDAFGITANGNLIVYGMSPAVVGGWNGTSSAIALTLQAGEAVTVACGTRFVAVVGQASGKLNRVHWNGAAWVADAIVQLAGTTGALCASLAVQGNRLLAISAGTGSGNLTALLMSLDPFGTWTSVTRPAPRPLPTISTLRVVLGDGYGVYTASGGAAGAVQVSCDGVNWPADVSRLDLTRLVMLSLLPSVPVPALVIRGEMVGLGGQLFRYQGSGWSQYSADAATYPGEQSVTSVSCGFDMAVRTMAATGGSSLFDLAVYNPAPAAGASNWSVPSAFAGAAPTSGNFAARAAISPLTPSRYAVFPVVSGQTWSNGVYAQGNDGSWAAALSVTDTLSAAETTSLQVLGNSCCVYQTGANTVIYPLRNGLANPASRISLSGQSILVPAGTGQELVGPSTFVTYAGTWGAAGMVLTLHRMVAGGVSGVQSVPALASTALDDGYAIQTLAVAGDPATTTVTPDGWRAAYNQMTSAQGTTNVTIAPNGVTLSWFFNGLTAQDTPAQPYPTGSDTNVAAVLGLVQGQLYGRKDRSAGPGSPPVLSDAGTTAFSWWGYQLALTQVAGDLRTGFYARQRRLVRVLDGVTTNVRTSYAPNDSTPPVTGLPTMTATDRFNASGQIETVTQTPSYFWQMYDTTRALNILTPVVQSVDATNGTTTAITIETWRNDWPNRPGVWAPSSGFQALSAAPAAFNWSTGTGPASSWLMTGAVVQRSGRSVPIIAVDAVSRYGGSVRDAADRVTTATFANARLDQAEAGYYGCEPYEADLAWSYTGAGSLSDHIFTTQAHTGTCSIQIDPVAAGVKSGPSATFLNTVDSRRYLFSCWLLTDIGFGATAGTAQWEMQVYTATATPTAVGAPIVLALPDTVGKWVYLHQIIDLAAIRAANPATPAGTALTVRLIAYNQKTGKRCWVDELRFSPLDATYQATVFDTSSLLPSAALSANGQTIRYVRDAARMIAAMVGPDENVTGISSFNYARALSGDGTFDPNLPNSRLRIGGLDNGVYYDFDPSDKADWTLPDAFWDVSNRQLVYTGAAPAGTFSQATLTSFSHGKYAMKVEVQRQAGSGGTMANVRIGTGNVYVTWDQTTSNWTLFAPVTAGGAAQAMVIRPGRFASTLTFATVEELVLFYADGQQIFCDHLPTLVLSDGKLILGLSGPGAFSELVCAVEPMISLDLFDGAGKPMQTLSIVDGETVVASGTLYDGLQRPQYGKDPINNPLMIGAGPTITPPPPSTAEQNRLIGDINSYLPYVSGQPMSVAQYTAPANGYPFSQTVYENAPTSRVLEKGAPGATFAVGSGHSYRYVYGANTASDPLTPLLPAGSPGQTPGSYNVVTITDPNNVVSYQLINQSGQVLATRVRTGGTNAAPVYQTSMFLYDPAGRLITTKLPNYFSPPAGSTLAPWVLQYGYDFIGRGISQTTPDSGQTQYAYDSAGRLRFAMDAEGAAQAPQRFKYVIYDGLDRVLQTGVLQQAGLTWAGLATYVDQPAWPGSGQGATIYAQNVYDADGAGSNNLEGRLWQASIDNGSAGLTIDAWSYDRRGNATARKTSASGYGATVYQSATLYNNLSLPIMMTYPQTLSAGGVPVGQPFQVTYFYDRLGQLAGVGQPPAGGEVLDPEQPRNGPEVYYGSYHYSAMGQVTDVTLNALSAPIQRSTAYNSAGWPTAIGGDYYAESLTYDQGGFNGAAYYNGQIASASSIYAAKAGADPWVALPTQQRQWAYQYDALGRSQVADPGTAADIVNAALAIGTAIAPVSYDANGNLLTVPRGPSTEQYSYLTGVAPNQVWNTNQVQSVSAAIQATIQFAAGQTYPGWTWGASNGGPSASVETTPTGGAGEALPPGQALQLAGGSPGHAEVLQFQGFLAMGGTYQLSYWVKTPDPFAAQPGPAGWSLRLFTDAGEIVDAPIRDIGTGSTTWLQVSNVAVNVQSIVDSMGLDSHVVSVALVLINGRCSGGSAAGAPLLVANISVTGSASAGQYGYTSPNGYVTSASGRGLTSLTYHPLTGLTTGVTVSGSQAKTVTYAYGQGTQRSVQQWTDTDGTSVKILDLAGPNGQPLARRNTSAGGETVSYFLHGPEGQLATVPAAATTTTYYSLNDHLGSVRAVVDQTGVVVQTYDYGPFGEVIQGPVAPLQPYAYTGQPIDAAIGLSNYQARLYDPALRRFYAPDPAHEGASPYAYVSNNPINATDPTGNYLLPAIRGVARFGWAVATNRYVIGVASAAIAAVPGFSTLVMRNDFYDTWIGQQWNRVSKLENWPKTGPLKYVHDILKNFSRDELIIMMKYFPALYPATTPAAWWLIYRPVETAVIGVGNGQERNAVRHVTWMCSAKRFLNDSWYSPSFDREQFAIDLGEAHEAGRKGDYRDQISDRINNAIALHLADVSQTSCIQTAKDAWAKGILASNHEHDDKPFIEEAKSFIFDPETKRMFDQVNESWRAGLAFLATTTKVPMFDAEDLAELQRRGITYTPPGGA